MGREDTNRLCAASPVRELSIRPARESEHSGPSESDMACRTIRVRMGQGFERIVRVTAGWTKISKEIRYVRSRKGGAG